jgi:uncharacterized damage-inducible protein DinB
MALLFDLNLAADYNRWANSRIYNAASKLTEAQLKQDRQAFFGSIHNTMNHILLSDLIYRERLEKKPTTFTRLDDVLYDDFTALETAHRINDGWYVGLDNSEKFSLPLRTCLTNLFQHQIHHRGQVHNMLSQTGIEPPPVDVVLFQRGDIDDWSDR